MKAYLNYFKLRFITNLQYRAAALAGLSTQFLFGFGFIMVYLAFYENTSNPLPMPLDKLITYLWLQQGLFALIYPYEKDRELLDAIKNGNLAYEIIRPQDIFTKFYVKLVAKKSAAALLRCIPLFIITFLLPEPYKLGLPVSIPAFICFLIALLISCLLVSALSTLVNILTMFTVDSKGLISIYGTIAEILSGTNIPIVFFPLWLKKIAEILPFRYITDFPFRLYIGDIPLSQFTGLFIQSIIWLVVIYIIGELITKKALRKAVIQGG